MENIHINNFAGHHVHFIGIGGISMSALAEILMSKGYIVSGSDLSDSGILHNLKNKGAIIYLGHDRSYIYGADLIVHTAAVKLDNPEMQEAMRKHIPIMQRAVLLGQIMQTFSTAIGISGSHGKTTATSMVSLTMDRAGVDPTVLIGGELNAMGGNVRIGKGQYFVTEACEYMESFLHFHPYIAVILNIDRDHLDYFKDMDHIYSAFVKFAQLVPRDGYVIGCIDDSLVEKLLHGVNCNTISYGISKQPDWKASLIDLDPKGCVSFNATYKGRDMGRFSLNVPGRHNIYNALATMATSHIAGIALSTIKDSLYSYCGTQRRFEVKGSPDDITVIDDYAHHPAEIIATLATARLYPHNKIWCVFQPHTYTRTKKLFDEFVTAFTGVDNIIITDIYSAREKDTGEVHSSQLADAISLNGQNCSYISSFDDIAKHLKNNARPGDLIMTMGAGDVNKIGDKLLSIF